MATALNVNKNGTLTLYVAGKKVMTGELPKIVEYLSGDNAPQPKRKKEKLKSRAARWGDAAGAAVAALEELQSIKDDEFQPWLDNLPENLQNSPLGEKLTAVCELGLDTALETAQECESIDLPLGFGRD